MTVAFCECVIAAAPTNPEGPVIMYTLMLYHHPLSVCSMKVRLALEEKGLPWSGRVIDIVQQQEQLEPWYLALNPKGVVPTLQYSNGANQVVTDSAAILRFIGALAEGRALVPRDGEERELMNTLIDLADNIDLQILSYARHPSQEKSGSILDARIEKARQLAVKHPQLQDSYRECAERSEKAKALRVSREHVEPIETGAIAALSEIESRLQATAFIVGDAYTLADVIWTVVLSRLELLGYDEWINGERFPRVSTYYERMRQRESFVLAQVQNHWWTH